MRDKERERESPSTIFLLFLFCCNFLMSIVLIEVAYNLFDCLMGKKKSRHEIIFFFDKSFPPSAASFKKTYQKQKKLLQATFPFLLIGSFHPLKHNFKHFHFRKHMSYIEVINAETVKFIQKSGELIL